MKQLTQKLKLLDFSLSKERRYLHKGPPPPDYWSKSPNRTDLEQKFVDNYGWTYPPPTKFGKNYSRSIKFKQIENITQHLKNYGGCFFYTSLRYQEPQLITPGMFQKLQHFPVFDLVDGVYQLKGVIDTQTYPYILIEGNPQILKNELIYEVLDQFVHSIILGDANVRQNGQLRIAQRQCEFTIYKYMILQKFCNPSCIIYREYYDRRYQKWYCQWRFITKCLFKHYYHQYYTFYNGQKYNKAIPSYIDQFFISALAIKNLVEDDGKKHGNTVAICSDGFLQKERKDNIYLLTNALKKNFSLDSTVWACGTIRIRTTSFSRLKELIGHLLLPIFHYKLQINQK